MRTNEPMKWKILSRHDYLRLRDAWLNIGFYMFTFTIKKLFRILDPYDFKLQALALTYGTFGDCATLCIIMGRLTCTQRECSLIHGSTR